MGQEGERGGRGGKGERGREGGGWRDARIDVAR